MTGLEGGAARRTLCDLSVRIDIVMGQLGVKPLIRYSPSGPRIGQCFENVDT